MKHLSPMEYLSPAFHEQVTNILTLPEKEEKNYFVADAIYAARVILTERHNIKGKMEVNLPKKYSNDPAITLLEVNLISHIIVEQNTNPGI